MHKKKEIFRRKKKTAKLQQIYHKKTKAKAKGIGYQNYCSVTPTSVGKSGRRKNKNGRTIVQVWCKICV